MYVCCQIYWPHDDAKERVYDVVRVTRVGRSKGPVHTTVLDVSFIKDNVSHLLHRLLLFRYSLWLFFRQARSVLLKCEK